MLAIGSFTAALRRHHKGVSHKLQGRLDGACQQSHTHTVVLGFFSPLPDQKSLRAGEYSSFVSGHDF